MASKIAEKDVKGVVKGQNNKADDEEEDDTKEKHVIKKAAPVHKAAPKKVAAKEEEKVSNDVFSRAANQMTEEQLQRKEKLRAY